MRHQRLTSAFILAASLGLGACTTTPVVDSDTCTGWSETKLRVPLFSDSFSKSGGYSSTSCAAGMKIGLSALLGMKPDKTLHPGSIITWQKSYKELSDKIAALTADETDAKSVAEARELNDTRRFADHFILKGSKGSITSQMAQAMFDMKVTDPTLFTPDGKFAPPKPAPQKERVCKGFGLFRVCDKPADPTPGPTPE